MFESGSEKGGVLYTVTASHDIRALENNHDASEDAAMQIPCQARRCLVNFLVELHGLGKKGKKLFSPGFQVATLTRAQGRTCLGLFPQRKPTFDFMAHPSFFQRVFANSQRNR